MKTKLFLSSVLSLLFASSLFAQDRTTVNATSSEISDNLDLRAVASIFGDSRDLEDFERRLNDPETQISNLDLNNDNQVDYLRVIESVEGNTHLIVVQSVLGRDTFQDVATVEVQKDRNNRVQVQVVGDVYMYGSNYIYEPVYVSTPIIYTHFWTPVYRPYCSSWYWDYYPSYYTFWNPCPVFRYRHNVGIWINFNHSYNYSYDRRCQVAYNNYYGRRSNGYERQYPNRSFSDRNSGYSNRRELEKARPSRDVAYANDRNNIRSGNNSVGTPRNNSVGTPRNNSVGTPRSTDASPRSSEPRNNSVGTPRNNSIGTPRNTDASPRSSEPRSNSVGTPRNNSIGTPRNTDASPRSSEPRNNSVGTPRNNSVGTPRSYESSPRSSEPRNNSVGTPRSYESSPRSSEPRQNSAPQRSYESPRQSTQQASSPRDSGGSSRGNSESRGSRR